MKNIIEEIRNNYKVDGEEKERKYIDFYESKEQIEDERDIESFEEQFDVNVDELSFPVITFDSEGSVDGWCFDSSANKEEIMDRASDYFEVK